ncbi:hypothetical protein KR52_04340 [Synechococcus sp. KORDI-52]|nr:hypothetical protein KR52_04340 [Synechococcus sp. KORDI-52]
MAPVAALVFLGGCGQDTPTATALPPAPVQPALPETSAPTAPAIGLIPLPSIAEVQQAAPGGRADPFSPLSMSDGQADSTLTLTGILTVGNQQRALVTSAAGTGVICVGAQGRCGADVPMVLPTGLSVLSIDVERGCIHLALNGEPQAPVCMA